MRLLPFVLAIFVSFGIALGVAQLCEHDYKSSGARRTYLTEEYNDLEQERTRLMRLDPNHPDIAPILQAQRQMRDNWYKGERP